MRKWGKEDLIGNIPEKTLTREFELGDTIDFIYGKVIN